MNIKFNKAKTVMVDLDQVTGFSYTPKDKDEDSMPHLSISMGSGDMYVSGKTSIEMYDILMRHFDTGMTTKKQVI